jgi:Ca-activated chloride channel homolog
VKIQIEFNPAMVKAYRLIGYENRLLAKEDFNNDKKDAGEIGNGHTVTALYEIIPPTSSEKVSLADPLEYQSNAIVPSSNLMTFKLRYKAPDQDTSKLIIARLSKEQINNLTPSDNFKLACSVAEFGMILRDSEFKGNASFAQLQKTLLEIPPDENGYITELQNLIKSASNLRELISENHSR